MLRRRANCGNVRDGARGSHSDGLHVVRSHVDVHGYDGVATHFDGHLQLSGGQSRKRLGGAYARLRQPRPDLAHAHVLRMPGECMGRQFGARARDSVHAVDETRLGGEGEAMAR